MDITTTLPPETLSTAAAAAAASLKADLKAAGNTDSAALEAFIAKYAPLSANWSLNLANAKLTNNDADITRYSQDLAGIGALAAAEAAIAAINAVTIVQKNAETFLVTALGIAAKAALGTLLAV